MKLLDTLSVKYGERTRFIKLYRGDLAHITAEDAADILVISAFFDNFEPTPDSMVGMLDRNGISVRELADAKTLDLREASSCWLVEMKNPIAEPYFRHLLCLESEWRGPPPTIVGDIFRSLAMYLGMESEEMTVVMPLIATGNQGYKVEEILEPLLDAAVEWMRRGLPIKELKIVERSQSKLAQLQSTFDAFRSRAARKVSKKSEFRGTDVFVSYSHQNKASTSYFVEKLRAKNKSLKIFHDILSLNTGAAWQQEIYDVLDSCRMIVAMYTPDYFLSDVCVEEYNIARLRHREEKQSVLFPVYLESTQLPPSVRVIHYNDCRESSRELLSAAAGDLLQHLNVAPQRPR